MLKVVGYKDGSIQIEDTYGYVFAITVKKNDKLIILDPRLDPNISEAELRLLESEPLTPSEIALRLRKQGFKAKAGWLY